jgi:hypothetical protein
MTEFWVSSGHLLLDRAPDGRLLLTDDFLRAFLARPELMPPPEACAAERTLHASLMATPYQPVTPQTVASLADADARENWSAFLAFRDTLLDALTLEDAYIRLVRQSVDAVPPLFLAQLVHVILRTALHDVPDPFTLRAAELFFRPQRVTTHEGRVLLADAEAIEQHEQARRASPLLAMLGGPAVTELEILTEATADTYHGRSDAHDLVLDLGTGREGLAAAIRIWIGHLLRLEAEIEPIPHIDDPDWRWFVGLDAEATHIGNALWHGESPPEAENLLALFRLHLPREAAVLDRVRGRPIYLLLGAAADGTLRMKPQNLVTGLPLLEQA